MRTIVFGLTLLAVILFVIQFFGKKGTRGHVMRGILVGVFSLVVVVINTWDISLKRGLTWDVPFLAHTIPGTGFFISLGITALLGYLLRHNPSLKNRHRIWANITGSLLFLTLAAAVLIRFFR